MNFSDFILILSSWISIITSWIWGMPLIVSLITMGIYFSFRTSFLQIRYLIPMIHMLRHGKSSKFGISSFQAFSLALAGRVGTGNIAGIATAIALGGPGAVFWMWITSFFGAATSYVETSLAQIYKEKIDGHYRGGPAFYILKGLENKTFAKIFAMTFAIVTLLAAGMFMYGIQSNTICDAFENSFALDKRITAGFIVLLLAVIIFGGVKRLARVAEIITPFMAIGYLLIAGIVIAVHYQQVPAMFLLIVKSAFGFEQAVGGIVGSAILMGVRRGLYSNEAGLGTAPHAAAACEVPHPAQQGLVQAFSIYVDTLLVCSATAFMILITGMYNVYNPDGSVLFSGGKLPETVTTYGTIFTQIAVDTVIPKFGSIFIAIALFFFAFTTIMSCYFEAESNLYFLFRNKRVIFYTLNILRFVFLFVTFFSGIDAKSLAWDMADIGAGLMAWLNLIALILLSNLSLKVFFDYEKQVKRGIINPTFDPEKLGIKNTTEWKKDSDSIDDKDKHISYSRIGC